MRLTNVVEQKPKVEKWSFPELKVEFEKFQKALMNICTKYIIKSEQNFSAGTLFHALQPNAKKALQQLFPLATYLGTADFKEKIFSNDLYFSQLCKHLSSFSSELTKSPQTQILYTELSQCLMSFANFTTASNVYCLNYIESLKIVKESVQDNAQKILSSKHELEGKVSELNSNAAKLGEEKKKLNQTVSGLKDEAQNNLIIKTRLLEKVTELDKITLQLNEDKNKLDQTVKNLQIELDHSRAERSKWIDQSIFMKTDGKGAAIPAPKEDGTPDIKKLGNTINQFRLGIVVDVLLPFYKDQFTRHLQYLDLYSKPGEVCESKFLINAKLADQLIKDIVTHVLNPKKMADIYLNFKPIGEFQESLQMNWLTFEKKSIYTKEADEMAANITISIKRRVEKEGMTKERATLQLKCETALTLYQLFNSKKINKVFEPNLPVAETYLKMHKDFTDQIKVFEQNTKLELAETNQTTGLNMK